MIRGLAGKTATFRLDGYWSYV